MEAADVLIVGGGPAGSACAWKLVRAGLRVTILDRAVFPRPKPCAGWVTPAVFEALELEARHYGQECLLQPVSGFLTGLLDGAARRTEFGAVVSYAVRRTEFDHYLLRRSGARAEQGVEVAAVERCDGWWRVNERWRAPLLVGAGGHFCPVARRLGLRPTAEAAVVAQVAEFEMEEEEARLCQARGECPELYFVPELDGYGWCVRKRNWLNAGIGALGARRRGEQLEALVERLRRTGRIGAGRRLAFQGHAYLLRRGSRRPGGSDGVLLVGDAAGLAEESSGEGIRPAVESGLAAAQLILDAGGDPRRLRVDDYEAELRRRFGPAGVAPARAEAGWGRRQAARLLLSGPEFLRRAFLQRRFLRAAA
jgi:flavin-dependent dehydrogenase